MTQEEFNQMFVVAVFQYYGKAMENDGQSGDIPYVKGNGSTYVMCVSDGIMNSHNNQYWSGGQYDNVQYTSLGNVESYSHLFVYHGAYWVDYFCSER